ncbi:MULTISPECIES: MbtH family NRPS accessory protein [unclassified Streptomyces]|uniref:MbtH family protein n=1 Tax=unclassified Streptomyces TaxID=2593676 RepID=UPI000CD51795|nr:MULTISPECIES: MbtH family NRPS accessory protein [unclassified Streptomyces]AWL37040.1 MbtH family protein [Streptomyces sp. SM18]
MSQTATENTQGDGTLYVVVTNHEDQHSIWPAHRDLPDGWRARTSAADRQTCLDHIAEHWTDMRPKSLREREHRP